MGVSIPMMITNRMKQQIRNKGFSDEQIRHMTPVQAWQVLHQPLSDAAHDYAERGWKVLPVKGNSKIPLIRDWPTQATDDEDQLDAWWIEWSNANVGVCCGASGLVVVDLDVKGKDNGIKSWEKLCDDIGIPTWGTYTVETPSGGRHLYFKEQEGLLKNKAGIFPGVDVRANGGFVVAPPSLTEQGEYKVLFDQPIAPLPEEVFLALNPPKDVKEALRQAVGVHPYAQAAVKGELGRLLEAKEGRRNNQLNRTAHALGQLTGAPWSGLDRAGVENLLLKAALDIGLEEDEAVKTIESGLNAGEADPRDEPVPLDKKGDDLVTAEEYVEALRDLGYDFKMNQCQDRLEVNGIPMTDALEAKIRSQLRDAGFPAVNVARDAYIAHAYDHSYHPVHEYLDNLEWDGENHISALAGFFTDKHGVFPLYVKKWLIGAVAKAYGGAQNRMLVLDGKQSVGKSYFVRWLCPDKLGTEYFIEGPIQLDDKDSMLRLISAWVWEVAELGSTTRKADREALKFFLTRENVTVRAPYGKYDLNKSALASFIGTVNNESGILNDPTGSRRFMIAKIESINWAYSEYIDVDQLWAQAKALYDQGEMWMLDADEANHAAEINEEYDVADVFVDYFEKAVEITGDPMDWVSTIDLLRVIRDWGWRGESSQRYEAMTLAKHMTKLGVEKSRRLVDGSRLYGYQGITVTEVQREQIPW